ncbi:hypothetical protein GCM10012288_08010 [Malaciobacter pacificus]|uniref:Uncharacterized protein n=1 Tax=Malaciobacter pacificus TaxID=1080223 RepID=A0A5C2HAA2_9BACT|nr:hypothetical protein [Malaciobacter pacificus]QEP35148.1 hypothetical protein APAC_2076 [Malaciobacter pacificus]GGD36397.1 hypothetical protein GCM10012288_08010 [Malaciobacter pacificus]
MAEEIKDNSEETTQDNATNQEEIESNDATEEKETDIDESNDTVSEEAPKTQDKKKSLISKILIGIVALLLLVLIAGIVLYFTGFFDPKPIEKPMQIETKESTISMQEKKYKFDISTINSTKLNEQLAKLTNRNLNQEKLEEQEKLENEKKLLDEKKKKEEEAIKAEQEALLKEKENLEAKKQELENEKAELERLKKEAIELKEQMINVKNDIQNNKNGNQDNQELEPVKQEESINSQTEDKNNFVKLINVAKIKGELYKDYLDSIVKINSELKLCRDDKNRIEIFFGPFTKEEDRNILLNELIENNFNQSYSLELTKEEYDKRCNY